MKHGHIRQATACSMVALQAGLAISGPQSFLIRMDAQTVDELKAKLLDLTERAEAIQAQADAESRDVTQDEQDELDRITGEFESVDAQLERRQRIEAMVNRTGNALAARRTDPGMPGVPPVQPQAADPAHVRAGARATVPAQARDPRESERWGFASFGHFAMAVRRAHPAAGGGRNIDPRLTHFMDAPTTVSTEGVGEDGGFAVPPEFNREIVQKVFAEDSLVAMADVMESASNTWTSPKDETTPWQTTGGIQSTWEGEGDVLAQSKVNLGTASVRLNKLTTLVPMTSELLEDAPGMDSYLRRKAPEKMDFRITDALLRGSGAGMPLGILNSPCLVTVAKEGSQAADTIVFNNVNNMYSRMYARWRASAVWLINQDIEPQLASLNHPGDSRPVFMPPGGLSAAPYGTILGRPIIPTEACSTLGDVGDIIFASMGQYLAIRKVGGIRTEVSIHLWFDYDTTAFRFILRLGGQPWWSAAIARFKGGNTLSPFVTLAERA